MLTIGFTNQFYTLWSVQLVTSYGAGSVVNGKFQGTVCETTKYRYLQNLSYEFEAAKAKVKELVGADGKYEIDLELRGDGRTYWESTIRKNTVMEPDLFAEHSTFRGLPIADAALGVHTYFDNTAEVYKDAAASALWMEYLKVMATTADWKNTTYLQKRRAVHARRKMVELGLLVRCPHTERKLVEQEPSENTYEDTNYQYTQVKRSYATPKAAALINKRKQEADTLAEFEQGHHYADGERIRMEIKELSRFSYDTEFGTTFIVAYATNDSKLVKYMGGRPPAFEAGTEWLPVKATVKHSEYKGQKETRIQRIKVDKIN